MKRLVLGMVVASLACGGSSVTSTGNDGTGGSTGGDGGGPTGGGDSGDAGTAPAAQPVFFQVMVEGTGSGTVTSSPPGLSCPGTCGMNVLPGTEVTLIATAGSGSRFEGFGGQFCSGTTCTAAVSAAAIVHANFSLPTPAQPADPCAGLVPAALPDPKITQVPAFDVDPHACGFALADKAGNLYLRTGYRLTGNLGMNLSNFFPFLTLNQGLVAFELLMAPEGSVTAFAPDGTALASAPVHGYLSTAGPRANGGIVSVEADCVVGANVQATRIDADGKLIDTVTLQGQPCMNFFFTESFGIESTMDAQERLLLAADGTSIDDPAVPKDHFGARWFDAAGAPLSGWFDLGATASFTPLTGGGFALNVNGTWTGTLASGKTALGPPPAGFRTNTNRADLVVGGKAYAVYSFDSNSFQMGSCAIDIVEPGGKVCGTITPPGKFDLGGDGSILSVQDGGRDPDTNLCPVTSYPGVFK